MSAIGSLTAAGGFHPALATPAVAGRSVAAFDAAALLSGLHDADTAPTDSPLGVSTMKRTVVASDDTAPRTRSSTTDLAASIAKLNEAREAFRKEASLTPAQRARRDVLEAMNLTEDAIEALPPEQRKDIEQRIAVEVARRLREKHD